MRNTEKEKIEYWNNEEMEYWVRSLVWLRLGHRCVLRGFVFSCFRGYRTNPCLIDGFHCVQPILRLWPLITDY
jgi:hypothetical protein